MVLLLMLSAGGFASEAGCALKIRVLDHYLEPWGGTTVLIEGEHFTGEARTPDVTPAGIFSMCDLPFGKYSVIHRRFRKGEYCESRVDNVVYRGEDLFVTVVAADCGFSPGSNIDFTGSTVCIVTLRVRGPAGEQTPEPVAEERIKRANGEFAMRRIGSDRYGRIKVPGFKRERLVTVSSRGYVAKQIAVGCSGWPYKGVEVVLEREPDGSGGGN